MQLIDAQPQSTSLLIGEIEPVMLARLPTIFKKAPPRRIACRGGAVPAALRALYPEAEWTEVTDGADANLIWDAPTANTNFAPYTPALLQNIKRALSEDGVFFFATLGPQTLSPLHALCSPARTPHDFASWPSLIDLGNALMAAGLTRPVLDRETLCFTYTTAANALAELAREGWFDATAHATSRAQEAEHLLTVADGSVSVPFEIFYGVAWNAPAVPAVDWQALRFVR